MRLNPDATPEPEGKPTPKPAGVQPVQFDLPVSLYQRLREAARQRSASMSAIIRTLLDRELP